MIIRLLTLVSFALIFPVSASASPPVSIVLRESCPPSFEKMPDGTCKLVTVYGFYDSVQGAGLGGTQTSLPQHRDGFTPQQIDLGRYLFFDPVLSKDGSISCASCHHPDRGFSDDLPRSIGMGGEELRRAAPSLWNVAFLKKFFSETYPLSVRA